MRYVLRKLKPRLNSGLRKMHKEKASYSHRKYELQENEIGITELSIDFLCSDMKILKYMKAGVITPIKKEGKKYIFDKTQVTKILKTHLKDGRLENVKNIQK